MNLGRGACVDDNVTSVNDRVTGVNCRQKRVMDRVASVDHNSHVHTVQVGGKVTEITYVT